MINFREAGNFEILSSRASFLQALPDDSDKSKGKEEMDSGSPDRLEGGLDARVATQTAYGTADDERYIVLNISLPHQKPEGYTPPAEIVFCVDKSGSMQGNRIERVRNVILGLLEKVEEEFKQDRKPNISLSIIAFEDHPTLLLRMQKITQQNIDSLKAITSSLKAGGGTCIINAIDMATSELSVSHDPKASANLVFLTDGQDNSFYHHRDHLSSLQNTWLSTYTNLLAIGIGGDHDANILREIITSTKNSKAFLPNASYRYISEENGSSSNETTLKSAVDLIYRQAIEQAIHSIELSIESRDIKVLNTPTNRHQQFLLGGLSYGQTIQKILHYKAANPPMPEEISCAISVMTADGKSDLEGKFSLSPEHAGQAMRKAILIQELVSLLERAVTIESEPLPNEPYSHRSLSMEFDMIMLRNRGKPGYRNFVQTMKTLLEENPQKWDVFFRGPPSNSKEEEVCEEPLEALKLKKNKELQEIARKIEEWDLVEDADIKKLSDEILRAISDLGSSTEEQANRLHTTSNYTTSRSYFA